MQLREILEKDDNLKNFISGLSKENPIPIREVEQGVKKINTNETNSTNNMPINNNHAYYKPKEDHWSKLAKQQELESIKFVEEQHALNMRKNIYSWEAWTENDDHIGGIIFAKNIQDAGKILADNDVPKNFKIAPIKKGKSFLQLFSGK